MLFKKNMKRTQTSITTMENLSRAEIDTRLYRHIHPHRLRLGGVLMEAKVWLKSKTRNDRPIPFVIYARPRSGTTLLVNLLNQVQNLRCDGELLHDLVLRPVGF